MASDRSQHGFYRGEDGRYETRLASTMAETERLLEEATVEGFSRADALRAMRRESGREVKLSAEQRAEVRSLVEDSGYTRREAVEWVLAFGGDQ